MSQENDQDLARMNRREFLRNGVMAGAAATAAPISSPARVPGSQDPGSFELDETTISALQEGMKSGRLTARSITELYLARIRKVDKDASGPALNSILETNPDALSIAEGLDKERKEKGPRGPLHGIPVLLKDNIDTGDHMMTTAGSLALLGAPAPRDSFVAERLRQAGAVLLGKTNLSEWANIRSSHSSSGWSGRGGQTRNPYALDRNPCGSSSGSGAAISGNLGAVAVGTETDGSIVCPSSANGIVGIKPTVGLVSRAGIIPISHTQDTAGPMARTVTDAAILLGAMAGVDARDNATAESRGKGHSDYSKFLDVNGLRGARIGVLRKLFGFNETVDRLMEEALAAMKRGGATLVAPIEIASIGKLDDAENEVLMYELKADLNAYLASRGSSVPVHSLKEVIEFNEKNKLKEMPYFGQDLFVKAEAKGPLTSKDYQEALAKSRRLSRDEGIDAIMGKHQLDAIVAPTGGPAWLTDLVTGDHFSGGSSQLAAMAGYPNINVPAGLASGLPVGISFFGLAYSEPKLIAIAFAFEQLTKFRTAPKFLATVDVLGA